jgi:hypothetical protein
MGNPGLDCRNRLLILKLINHTSPRYLSKEVTSRETGVGLDYPFYDPSRVAPAVIVELMSSL